nr:uncharacterized protein LOC111504124 [Leptinotarsa decemlineata]
MSTVLAEFVSKKQCKYCVVCSSNSRENPQLSFFRIPKDDARCASWKAILKVDKLKEFTSEECYFCFRVCCKHFGSDMFANLQKNRLKKEAVPTGFSDEINPSEQDDPVVDDTGMSNISESVAGTSQGRQTYEDVTADNVSSRKARTVSLANTSTEKCKRLLSLVPGTSSSIDYENIELQYSDTSDAYIQTSTSLSAYTPRKLPLQNKIRLLQRQLNSKSSPPTTSNQQDSNEMEVVLNFIRKKCLPVLATFMETQLSLSSAKIGIECRYNNEIKLLALTIYFLGPKVYNFLKQIFRNIFFGP